MGFHFYNESSYELGLGGNCSGTGRTMTPPITMFFGGGLSGWGGKGYDIDIDLELDDSLSSIRVARGGEFWVEKITRREWGICSVFANIAGEWIEIGRLGSSFDTSNGIMFDGIKVRDSHIEASLNSLAAELSKKGTDLYEKGNYEEALKKYKEAERKTKSNAHKKFYQTNINKAQKELNARNSFEEGNKLFERNDFSGAITQFKAAYDKSEIAKERIIYKSSLDKAEKELAEAKAEAKLEADKRAKEEKHDTNKREAQAFGAKLKMLSKEVNLELKIDLLNNLRQDINDASDEVKGLMPGSNSSALLGEILCMLGDIKFSQKDYSAAIYKYREAISIVAGHSDIESYKQKLVAAEIKQKLAEEERQQQYNKQYVEGLELLKKKEYIIAIEKFKSAANLTCNDEDKQKCQDKIDETERKMNNSLNRGRKAQIVNDFLIKMVECSKKLESRELEDAEKILDKMKEYQVEYQDYSQEYNNAKVQNAINHIIEDTKDVINQLKEENEEAATDGIVNKHKESNKSQIVIIEQEKPVLERMGQEMQQNLGGSGITRRNSLTWDATEIYYFHELYNLLNLRLKDYNKEPIEILIPEVLEKNSIAGSAIKISDTLLFHSVRKAKTLLPILSINNDLFNQGSNHWVGIYMESTNFSVILKYLDSGRQGLNSEFKQFICECFSSKLANKTITFEELKVEIQKGNNCGPELIENFAYMVTGERLTQENAIYLHSLLLENSLLNSKECNKEIEKNNQIILYLLSKSTAINYSFELANNTTDYLSANVLKFSMH